MVREHARRTGRPLESAPIWVSFDFKILLGHYNLYEHRREKERLITLSVPISEPFLSMHAPWTTHILCGSCLDHSIIHPEHWSCRCPNARRHASWEGIFTLSGDPRDWQGILDRIEPCWLVDDYAGPIASALTRST